MTFTNLIGMHDSILGRVAHDESKPILNHLSKIGILCDSITHDAEWNLSLEDAEAAAINLIESLGYIPVIDKEHRKVKPYFNRWYGSPQERAAHFIRLLEDYDVDAVFPLFGKGGGSSVIDELVASDYSPSKKIVFIGSFSQHSDWGLFAASNLGSRFFSHTINATQAAYSQLLPKENILNLQSVLNCASSVEFDEIEGLNGAAFSTDSPIYGKLIGGNLGVVLSNYRKKWFPSFEGEIAFCEDYDRHAHDYHRQIEKFAFEVTNGGAKAILFGDHLPIRKSKSTARQAPNCDTNEIYDMLMEIASRLTIPVFYRKNIVGHGLISLPFSVGGYSSITPCHERSFKLINSLCAF